MKTIRHIIAIIVTLVFIFTLTACDSTSKAYIYFSLNEPPQTLDPQIASSDTELMIVRNIFEGLLREDENGKIVCGVAESYEKKGLTYTFKLRKDAQWSNEEPVTAHDFVFALRRAVTPETKSPFSKRLSCIKNADAILNGSASVSSLGVTAINGNTLKIELAKEDKNFEHTLTTSIAMPCKEEFFDESAGKYGLGGETIISNGSYRLTKWGKEVFGIRLYKNKFYNGDFEAKNAAVFLSIDKERTPAQVVAEDEADLAFINPTDLELIKQSDLKTLDYENICWFLTVSDGFSKGVRKSLITLANPQVFSKNLISGYSSAYGIYPPVLNSTSSPTGMPIYDLENAKELFKNEINNLVDKKFPTDVVLYYYDDGFSKTVVTDIVGHWQNQLGAFVNIEAVSAPSILLPQLTDRTYALSIFPVSADSPDKAEYLEKFGIQYNGENLSELQNQLLTSNNIVPLMTQKKIIAYSEDLINLKFTLGNGSIDFSYIVKED